MTSEIARKVVHAFREPPPAQAAATVLTAREREMLDLLCQGFVNKEVADKLHISYNTVKVDFNNIYKKLHVRSRTEAVLKFMNDHKEPASLMLVVFSGGVVFLLCSAQWENFVLLNWQIRAHGVPCKQSEKKGLGWQFITNFCVCLSSNLNQLAQPPAHTSLLN